MRLRIGHLSTVYHTALVMQALDMLGEKGLRAEWKLYGGGPAIVEAMEKGEVDIGYIGLPPAMTGIARGAAIKCVAGGHVEGTVLCTPAGASKQGVAGAMRSLEGMRIGSPPKGSIHDIIIRHLLRRYDVSAEVVNYPWADFIPLAIESGEVSAAIGTPALAVLLKRELGMEIPVQPGKLWPFNPSYGIIARVGLLDEQVLKVFLQVHEEATRLISTSPEKAAEAAAALLGFIDAEFALEAMRLSPRYCAALPRAYIQSTLAFVPVMLELGYLSRALGEEDVFHTRAISELHVEGDHYAPALSREGLFQKSFQG